MKKVQVIKPSFYDKFHCIGGECKNTCCKDWAIPLRKDEFKKIKRSIVSEELKSIFANAFEPMEGESLQKTNRYMMKLNENRNCPFWGEDGLCMIQKECGYEVLSKTCKVFPREGFLYCEERQELSLSLGCEAVVKLLLEEKEGFLLEVSEGEVNSQLVRGMVKPFYVNHRKGLRYFYDVKSLVIGILQNRSFTMGQRMALLGIALEKLHHMEMEKRAEDMPQYVQWFLNEISKEDSQYHTFFEKNKSNPHIKVVNTLQKYHRFTQDVEIRNQLEKIDAKVESSFIVGAQHIETKVTYDPEKYEKAVKAFEAYCQKNPHVLENLIVCSAWHLQIPFGYKKNIWENYCIFALLYSIFYFALSICITEDSTEEEVIKYVVLVARDTLHSHKSLNDFEEDLINNESSSLAHMIKLVL